jgi:NAD(P)H-flavin reductase/ferredoxin
MPKVIYGGQSYECGDHSVLDCLTAQGVLVPSSCHSGLCQTCLMQAVDGQVPARAQAGIKPTLVAQNYFLACVCHPEQDIEVSLPAPNQNKLGAHVSSIEYLNADILGIKIKPLHPFEYRPGQYINLYKDETTARCYSLASVPALDDELSLHIRKVPGGLMSSWIFENLKAGDAITISEASGDCFYIPDNRRQNILLVGTGSGLAPLYGIIRDALLNGHSGQIKLYHGSYSAAGLYLVAELGRLARSHANFSYVPCISGDEATAGYVQGTVLDAALRDNPDLSGWRIFLCGNPDMVNAARRETYLAGAAIDNIFADPF